ncbi:MAG: hypothetical protein C0478_07920 [Planctomyces sp.]|nr:hypothetical protein [Planctomyces sp.]
MLPLTDLRMAPLLAIDAGQIVGLLVLLFTVLSWVVNAIQGAQKTMAEKQAKANRNQPRNEPVATKIEDFLRDAGVKLSGENDKREAEARAEEARRRQAAIERRQAKEQQKNQQKKSKNPANQNRPQGQGSLNRPIGQGLGNTPVGSGALPSSMTNQGAFVPATAASLGESSSRQLTSGEGSQRHVSQFAAAGSSTAGPSQFGSLGNSAGNQAGGQTSNIADPTRMAQATGSHPLLDLLKKPGGVATAVLLNEILSRPRALRRDAD